MDDQQHYDLFISYAHADSEWVFKLVDDLHDMGYDAWLDRDSIRLGKSWRNEIRDGIQDSDYFLIVVTPNSAASNEVLKEIDAARAANKPIIPIIKGEGLGELGVDSQQGVDFRSGPYDAALDTLTHKLADLGLAIPKKRPKEMLRDVLRDGTRTYGTLAKQWRNISFGSRDDDAVAVRFALDETGTAAFLVGPRNERVRPPETVQVFLQFTGYLDDTTFDDYLYYARDNRLELHTILIRGPQDPNLNEYVLPIDRNRNVVWDQVVKFIVSAINEGAFQAQRLAFYLNTPNALSIVLGNKLKLRMPYEIFHYTGRNGQRDMYVRVYEYTP